MCHSASALTGRRYKNWLMELRNSHSDFKSSNCALIDRLLEGYDNARHGAGVSLNQRVCVSKFNRILSSFFFSTLHCHYI